MRSEDLRVIQQAERLSDQIWSWVKSWDYFEKKVLGEQLTRASDSVGANLAEGFGRHHHLDSLRHYYVARGSLEETKYWLRRVKSRHMVDSENVNEILREFELLSRSLNAFIASHIRREKISPSDHPVIKSSSHP